MILSLTTLGVAISVGMLVRKIHDRQIKIKNRSSQQTITTESAEVFNNIVKSSKSRLRITDKVRRNELIIGVSTIPVALIGAASVTLTTTAVAMIGFVRGRLIIRGFTSMRKREITIDHVNLFALSTCLLSGHIIASAFVLIIMPLREHVLEAAEEQAKHQITTAFIDLPAEVWVLIQDVEMKQPLSSLKRGDIVVVNVGSIIPVDGEVVHGDGVVDKHQFTGEWEPAEVAVGDAVLAGTLLNAGRLQISASRTGNETRASEITRVLHNAADKKQTVRVRSEKFADDRAPLSLALGVLSMPFIGGYRAAGLAICGPGSAFRFTAPICVLRMLSVAAESDILIKDGRSLELLQDIDTVVFDKTGTLTENQLRVVNVWRENGVSTEEIVRFSAATEQGFEHPIADAILAEAGQRQIAIPPAVNRSANFGLGITADVENNRITLGSRRFLQQQQIQASRNLEPIEREAAERGNSMVFIARGGTLMGAIELSPTLRTSSYRAISELKNRDIQAVIISGDNESSTRSIAKELGIETYFAEVMPEEKAAIVERLQADGHKVCFIGDGINDSPALKCADVSISLRGSTTLALDSAQIVLATPDLGLIIQTLDIAKQFRKNIERSKVLTEVIPLAGLGIVVFLNAGFLTMAVTNMASFIAGLAVTTDGKRRKRNE